MIDLPRDNTDGFVVEWTVQVEYDSADWPLVKSSGRLTADHMSEMIKPSSWIRTMTLQVFLHDSQGRVLPYGGPQNPDNIARGDLTIKSSNLERPYQLGQVFETSDQQMVKVRFPAPEQVRGDNIEYTIRVQALRDGIARMDDVTIPGSDNWVVCHVYSSGQIAFDQP